MKGLKESNTVDVAEFAKAKGLMDEPAFDWWVPFVLKKRDVIISKMKARLRKASHKFGIKVPRSVKEALVFDETNGNTFWQDAIAKEMHNNAIAFRILEPDENLPVGSKKASGHMVFDLKMDFTRKARWVMDGHR